MTVLHFCLIYDIFMVYDDTCLLCGRVPCGSVLLSLTPSRVMSDWKLETGHGG